MLKMAVSISLGAVIGVVTNTYSRVDPLTERALKAENELMLIEQNGVVLRGLDTQCTDWKMRIECRDNSEAGWNFLYVDKKDKNE